MPNTIINGTDMLLYKQTTDAITTNTLNAGGTGYAVNDLFYVSGGTSLAIGRVLTLSVTAVATYELLYTGAGYTTGTGASAKATTNKLGTGSGLKINVAAVSGTVYQATGHSTSHSLSLSMSARDISSKASGNYVNRDSGRLDVSGSAEGLSCYADTLGYRELCRIVTDREKVYLLFANNASTYNVETSPNTAVFYARGYFYITSVEITAPDQDNMTYTISLELASDFELIN